MLFLRRTSPLVFAVLVAAFVALYPYLDTGGLCDLGGCPDALQTSHTVSHAPMMYAVAVLAAVPALSAFATFGRRHSTQEAQPTEWYISPDPRPPQLSF